MRTKNAGYVLLITLVTGVAGLLWLASSASRMAAAHRDAAPDAIVAKFSRNVQTEAMRSINAQEEVVGSIRSDILRPWCDSWTRGQNEGFDSHLASRVQASVWSGPPAALWRTRSSVSEYKWTIPSPPAAGQQSVASMSAQYLAQFSKIEFVAVEPWAVDLDRGGGEARLLLRLDVRGIDKSQQRRQDRGFAEGVFHRAQGGWQLSELTLRSMETLTAAHAAFADVTSTSGLARMPCYQRIEAIRRGGYAVAVGDYDGDGRADIYVGAWGAGKLFRNQGNGTFEDVTTSSGLGGDTLVKAAAFVDLRNRGHKDLILSRFAIDGDDEIVVYENSGGGRFQRMRNSVTRVENYDRAMPMAVADFNHDGLLDVYVGFPGAQDFTVLSADQQTLAPQGIFLNQGNGRFLDVTRRSRLNQRVSGLPDSPGIYPHSSVAVDWNGSGVMDITVMDDRRNGASVFRQDKNNLYADVSRQLGIHNDGWGMGIAVGDFNGDGLQDVYLTNVDFLASKRIAAQLPPRQSLYSGNHLFQNMGNDRFQDVTDKAGLSWAGEAAGGASWLDFDNDGCLDLYVANGLWTGPGQGDLSSLFVRDYLAERQAAQERRAAAASQVVSDVGMMSLEGEAGGHLVMRVLTDYRGDLQHAGVPPSATPTLSMGGYQRNCLFRGNGDGSFTEVAYPIGVDRIEDGYVPATIDYDHDGKVDVLLRNADPGTKDKLFPPVMLLHNDGQWKNHYLTVTLQGDGKKSNRDAVGATIWLWADGKRQSRQITALAGASQSEMVAHFGLGAARRIQRLQVRWPSGRVQNLHNLSVDRLLTLQEPR